MTNEQINDEFLDDLERRHINRSVLDDDSFKVLAVIDEVRRQRNVIDRVTKLANEMHNEQGQAWNSVSAQRFLNVLKDQVKE